MTSLIVMSFRIKRKEPAAQAIRRLGRERLDKALACMKRGGEPEAVHRVRQEIKKARAVLGLVRDSLRRNTRRRHTRLLRNAARHLAPLRDAHVSASALTRFIQASKDRRHPNGLQKLRASLQKNIDREARRYGKNHTNRKVCRLLRRVRREFNALKLEGKGWKALRGGVKTAYARGRRDYLTTAREPSAENFHEWRKRAKDLRHQVRLLRRISPRPMAALSTELKRLGAYLGQEHDLFVLQRKIARHTRGTPGLDALTKHMARRQNKLRQAALAIGSRLYTQDPSVFCQRLGKYWKRWKGCGS